MCLLPIGMATFLTTIIFTSITTPKPANLNMLFMTRIILLGSTGLGLIGRSAIFMNGRRVSARSTQRLCRFRSTVTNTQNTLRSCLILPAQRPISLTFIHCATKFILLWLTILFTRWITVTTSAILHHHTILVQALMFPRD